RPACIEARVPEHVEQRSPFLDELEQAAVRLQLVAPYVSEQVGGTADVETLRSADELGERRPQRGEESTLADAQSWIVEAAAQQRRPELQPGDGLVQILVRPLREPGVDCVVEMEESLRDAPGGRDDDDHHELRLKQQDLGADDRRRLERRRG